MSSGIYSITNTVNGKQYVGSSQDVARRWKNHQQKLRMGKHPNPHLQAAWTKYGAAAFVFAILEECSPGVLEDRENHWIQTLDTIREGYNILPAAYSVRGYRFTQEQRDRHSRLLQERWADPAYYKRVIQAIGDSHRRLSADERAVIATRVRALWATPEFRERVAQGHRATVRRIRTLTPDQRAKLAQSTQALWADAAYRERQAQGRSRAWTPERRARQAQRVREHYARCRAAGIPINVGKKRQIPPSLLQKVGRDMPPNTP